MILMIVAIVGLCLGSFVNALVWRLRQQELASKKSKVHKVKKSRKLSTFNSSPSTGKEFSILSGRSMCPHCQHTLSAADLVPVLSWLALKGKCRYCHELIGRQYPLVELATAALFASSYLYWPMDSNTVVGKINFIVWLVMLTGFMALLVYDLRWLLLPNRIIYPLMVLAAIVALANITVFHGGANLLRDTIISVGIAGGLFYILFMLSEGKWIGGGDVKLGFLIGLLITNPLQAFLLLFTASLLGTIVILPGMVSKKLTRRSKVPFGPFLIVATILVRLFGASVIAWYRKKFLLY